MSDLAPISQKLGSLIRLLGSDVPGEVVATASAIRRMLKKVGGDFHTLADRIEGNGSNGAKISEADMRRIYDAGYEAGLKHAAEEHHNNTGFSDTGSGVWPEIARFCQLQRNRLRQREREFIDDMMDKSRRHKLTDKQQLWLRSIYLRLGGEFAKVKDTY